MKYSERLDALEGARTTCSVLRVVSLAILVVSVTAYSATCQEAGVSIDPCLPQTDPETHGVSAAVLNEFSATIQGHFEDDYIVGAEFLVRRYLRRYLGTPYSIPDRNR